MLSLAGAANDVVLDWSTVSWPAGSLSNGYDVDPSNPGNDITVAITDPTNAFQRVAGPYPLVDSSETGGGASTAALQYHTGVGRSPSITTTITFNYTGGVYASLAQVSLLGANFGNFSGSSAREGA